MAKTRKESLEEKNKRKAMPSRKPKMEPYSKVLRHKMSEDS